MQVASTLGRLPLDFTIDAFTAAHCGQKEIRLEQASQIHVEGRPLYTDQRCSKHRPCVLYGHGVLVGAEPGKTLPA